MLLTARKQQILSILHEQKSVKLRDLGDYLHYSQATLRRDVAALETEGMIRRTHGQIHWVDQASVLVSPSEDRETINFHNKRLIARKAMELVSDKQTIILDSGTTVSTFARELANLSCNVVTNSLDAMFVLAKSKCQVYSCSGMLQASNMCFLGPDAERFFSMIEADIAFLGTTGVRGSQGLSTSSPLQYNVKKSIIQAARKRVVLFDNYKFQSANLYLFSDFRDIDAIVTNRPESDSQEDTLLKEIESKGVHVIFADDE